MQQEPTTKPTKQLKILEFFKRIIGFQERSMPIENTPSSQVFTIPDPAGDGVDKCFYDTGRVKRRLFEESGYYGSKRQRRVSSSSTIDTANEHDGVEEVLNKDDADELRRKLSKAESNLFKIEGYISRIDCERQMWKYKEKRVKRAILRLKCKLKNNVKDGVNSSQSEVVDGGEVEYDFETEALDDTESD